MTDREINFEMALAMGWIVNSTPAAELLMMGYAPGGLELEPIPNCCIDLNVVGSAVKTLPDEKYDGEDGFTAHLARVTQGEKATDDGWLFRPMQEATARQRSEAYLKTIGVWRA